MSMRRWNEQKLELLAGFLVDESRTVDSEDALVRGQRNRTADNSTGGFHRLYDLFCRLVDKIVIVYDLSLILIFGSYLFVYLFSVKEVMCP